MSLRELLRWAYSREYVDVVTGRTLEDPAARDPEPFHACSLDLPADGPRRRDAPPWRVSGSGANEAHVDAILIHDAVLALPDPYPRLLVEFGRTGQHPEPCEAIPRPVPFTETSGSLLSATAGGTTAARARRTHKSSTWGGYQVRDQGWIAEGDEGRPMPPDNVGTGLWRGEWSRHVVRAAEIIREQRAVYVSAGRGKMKLSHHEDVLTAVYFCPVDWWPDPAWCALCNALAEHWERALSMLARELAKTPLFQHEIADSDFGKGSGAS